MRILDRWRRTIIRKPMDLLNAIALMKKRTASLAPLINQPSKPLKGLEARNPAEQEAICRAVVLSVQKAEDDGLLVLTFDGSWRFSWTSSSIEEALSHQNPLLKHMGLAAAVASGFTQKGSQVTIVGGLAVEFYTNACYMARDINLVASRPEHIEGVMTELGCTNQNGIWHFSQALTLAVKFSANPLEADPHRLSSVHSMDAFVNIIGLEDLIISRAKAALQRSRGDSAEEWIRYMMAAHYERMDWAYLERGAGKEVADVIRSCRDWAKRRVGSQ